MAQFRATPTRKPRASLAPAALLLAMLVAPMASDAQVPGRYEGAASCAGSTCHGRSEGDGKVVRQDELRSWQEPSSKTGAHSRAFDALASTRGQRIAADLGLGKAVSAPACLGCHTTNAPAGQRGDRFLLSDGVTCESCHGAASGWLSSHYAVPATHGRNIANGLVPLERAQTRASVCLDCHYGSEKPGQFVTHSMMAAGHPRLSFELDLFSALQQHHDVDSDYRQRKGRVDSVGLWAVGQAEAVRRAATLFAKPALAERGLFPELYFFDCHSCHRAITDKPAARRSFEVNPGRPIAFGYPPFNDESIIMLSAVARVLAPGQAAQFDRASRSFHAAMGKGRPEAVATAAQLRAAAGALSNTLAARAYSGSTAFDVIAAISTKAVSPRFTDYAGSVQAVMAIDTMLNALVREGRITIGAAAGIRANINRAYGAVATPQTYRPATFRSALRQASASIGAVR